MFFANLTIFTPPLNNVQKTSILVYHTFPWRESLDFDFDFGIRGFPLKGIPTHRDHSEITQRSLRDHSEMIQITVTSLSERTQRPLMCDCYLDPLLTIISSDVSWMGGVYLAVRTPVNSFMIIGHHIHLCNMFTMKKACSGTWVHPNWLLRDY